MCFSASSSFTAAFFLLSVGGLALYKIKNKSQLMFASIPFLFGIQQASEGVVWLTINNSNYFVHKFFALMFMTFAVIIWPIWIPASLFFMEKGIRRILLFFITVIGTLIAVYIGYFMIKTGITTQEFEHSIFYDIGNIYPDIPETYFSKDTIAFLIYCIPTILPFFITRMPYAKIAGSCVFVSSIITLYIRYETFGSVWCFFAALLSIFVLLCLEEMNRKYEDYRFESLEDLV